MPVYFESRKNKRQTNQDSHLYMEYRINYEAMIRFFLVADGMGGLSCGEVASFQAVEKWTTKLLQYTMSDAFSGKPLEKQIEGLCLFSNRVMKEINEEIYQNLNDLGVSGGTTLTAGILFYHTLILANCGDSPAYYYNSEKKDIVKISKDQNVAEELLRQGKIEKNSPEYVQKKNRLTDYLGKYKEPVPWVGQYSFLPGDMLLIGSDGAFGSLKEEDLKTLILRSEERPEQAVKDILNASEYSGEEDNQTLICYQEEKKAQIMPKPSRGLGLFRKRQVV